MQHVCRAMGISETEYHHPVLFPNPLQYYYNTFLHLPFLPFARPTRSVLIFVSTFLVHAVLLRIALRSALSR